ncbi:uroporphyrinogen-III synthase [Recurvomyces mirabilis]|uniref:uroporphyrinogen-III synthase n=1 Tax=Recurvomyces mirabilis TaxID=574656 RepID=UPI002DE042BD|nr:uroporphyrinogen-III synthase [Recurvomyces mirabilis]
MEGVTSGLQDLSLDQIPVYLLKTKSSPDDTYEEHFAGQSNGKYKSVFVPVLEHMFRDDALRFLRRGAERFAFAGGSEANEAKLRKATHNPAKRYGGMIFTSQRAVDAFSSVVGRLEPSKLEALFDKDMPLYVVGRATARGVRALGLPCPVIGEETGNGEALAQFILEHRRTLSSDVTRLDGRTLPLLFLVGEQRRDIIPSTLQSEDLHAAERTPVSELVVYETGEASMFEEEFSKLLLEAKRKGVKTQWVVVFSPQGCEAMLNALGWLEETSGKYGRARREIISGPMKSYVATIGPTTRDFLMQEFGFEPDVCAATPSPEGVSQGIMDFTAT